jgi:TonB family protein
MSLVRLMDPISEAKRKERSARPAIAVTMKPLVLVAIAISSGLITLVSAAGAAVPALPPDAELKKMIVGSWRVDYPSYQSASHYGYETYREDGTYKQFSALQENSAGGKLLFDVSGTWKVEEGHLVKRITAANMSTAIGHVYRGKIESANRDGFIVQERGNSRTRRRMQLPAGLVSGAAEVPKVFTVEEAAKVLRYAVQPEYSYEARRTRTSGAGIFELRFDYETGRLKAIDIVQSTGSRLLDHDAIGGLKEWRAKPHTVRTMRIPIAFTLRR